MNVTELRGVEQLIEYINRGGVPDFLFFWGHTPKERDVPDVSCLSNWFPAEFEVDAHVYQTTEQFMMAEKARLFGDIEVFHQILNSQDPSEAKSLGRHVRGFRESVWNRNRVEIMVEGNFAKFSQNEEMGEFLKNTGSKILVEASPRDQIWGIGLGKSHQDAEFPQWWKGLNLLGFALMEVRGRLSNP